jgi:hypothetical protein
MHVAMKAIIITCSMQQWTKFCHSIVQEKVLIIQWEPEDWDAEISACQWEPEDWDAEIAASQWQPEDWEAELSQ